MCRLRRLFIEGLGFAVVTSGRLWRPKVIVDTSANILYTSLIGNWSMTFKGRHYERSIEVPCSRATKKTGALPTQ